MLEFDILILFSSLLFVVVRKNCSNPKGGLSHIKLFMCKQRSLMIWGGFTWFDFRTNLRISIEIWHDVSFLKILFFLLLLSLLVISTVFHRSSLSYLSANCFNPVFHVPLKITFLTFFSMNHIKTVWIFLFKIKKTFGQNYLTKRS